MNDIINETHEEINKVLAEFDNTYVGDFLLGKKLPYTESIDAFSNLIKKLNGLGFEIDIEFKRDGEVRVTIFQMKEVLLKASVADSSASLALAFACYKVIKEL